MITTDLLLRYGAEKTIYNKGDYIFKINDTARYFYQIVKGEVKIYNTNENGKEFIQSIFSKGRVLGESALLGDHQKYPTSCIAISKTELFQFSKEKFIQLLREHQDIHFQISKNLANRFYYKSIIATEISNENPDHRIIALLQYLKHTIYKLEKPFSYKVELTRQQIADLTGLRVETVIRSILKLEQDSKLQLIKHKIHI